MFQLSGFYHKDLNWQGCGTIRAGIWIFRRVEATHPEGLSPNTYETGLKP